MHILFQGGMAYVPMRKSAIHSRDCHPRAAIIDVCPVLDMRRILHIHIHIQSGETYTHTPIYIYIYTHDI